ncbi:MAG: methyl-accepting chemotaxis protein [Pseudomonadota bacterium]|nr:methyl-accepting chemotaxis protein [Pseudomonadota bacterium]
MTDSGTQMRATTSVGRRLVGRLAVGLAVGFTISVAAAGWLMQDSLTRQATGNLATISELVARDLVGAVRWKKAEPIVVALDRVRARDGLDLVHAAVVGTDGAIMAEPGSNGVPSRDVLADARTVLAAGADAVPLVDMDGDRMRMGLPIVLEGKGDPAVVGALMLEWSLAADRAAVMMSLGGLAALSLAVLAAILLAIHVIVRRIVSAPLRNVADALDGLSSGRTDVEISHQARRDEIGLIARAAEAFRSRVDENSRLEAERVEAEARRAAQEAEHAREQALARRREHEAEQQRATERAEAERIRAAGEREMFERQQQVVLTIAADLENEVARSTEELTRAADEIARAAQELSTTASRSNRRASHIRDAAGTASGSVETMATGIEQLSGSVRNVRNEMARVTEVVAIAVNQAKRSDTMVQGLAGAARSIGDVIEVISKIASQTNMLALNATVEAARAGELGKGFAVVASEVRSLASKTAEATEQIAQEINAVRAATENAVKEISGISDTIGQVNGIAEHVAVALAEQDEAASRIAGSVRHAAEASAAVTENVGHIATATDESASVSEEVHAAARALGTTASELENGILRFAEGLRRQASARRDSQAPELAVAAE